MSNSNIITNDFKLLKNNLCLLDAFKCVELQN